MDRSEKLRNSTAIKNKKIDDLLLGFEIDEEKTFKMLYDMFFTPLCLYSVKITQCYEQSKDIVQEFFIKFYEKKIYRSVKSDLRLYLYASIQHASMAYAGKMQNISLTGQENLADIPAEDDYDVEELSDRMEKIKKGLAELSENGYKVIKSVIMDDKKYREVAEDLGISVNTVKFHLTKSLRILRDRYTVLFIFVKFI